MDISSLVGGLGIGSVLTLFLKEYFDNKKTLSKRTFEEKREAYVSYLETIARTQNLPGSEGKALRRGATERVRLSASQEVIDSLIAYATCTEESGISEKLEHLVLTMRKDLFPQAK